MRTQLAVASKRAHITEEERTRLDGCYEEICKMLSGLIKRLEFEDHKRRQAAHEP